MSFSWFFGSSKKKSEVPPEITHETQGDEYVYIERTLKPEEDSGASFYPKLPYAVAPHPGTQSPAMNTLNVAQSQNFLSGVPFKLSPEVISIASDVGGNIVHANQFLSYITQLNMESFDYDFQAERSVILEGD